jgi:hypothetical protein
MRDPSVVQLLEPTFRNADPLMVIATALPAGSAPPLERAIE